MLSCFKHIILIVFLFGNVFSQEHFEDKIKALIKYENELKKNDSIVSIKLKQASDVVKAENDLLRLNLEKERIKQKELRLRNQEHKKYFLLFITLIGIIIMAYFVYLLFKQNKLKRKANRVLQIKNNLIERQQSDLISNLNYAKYIKDVYIPGFETSNAELNSFVFFQPKDVVGGDFYWVKEIDNKSTIIVAGDCTGHGVPGGFLSVISYSIIKSLIEDDKIIDPATILEKLHKTLTKKLESTYNTEITDGLDLCVCLQNKSKKELLYSSAKFPGVVCSEGHFDELKSNMQSVGKSSLYRKDKKSPRDFTNHTYKYSKNSMLYIFSDGYIDQFDSTGKKKFNLNKLREQFKYIYDKDMSRQKAILIDVFNSWKGGHKQIDDVMILGIRLN